MNRREALKAMVDGKRVKHERIANIYSMDDRGQVFDHGQGERLELAALPTNAGEWHCIEVDDKIHARILNIVDTLVAKFVYYDRQEDEELSVDELNDAVKRGVVSVDEMVAKFREGLEATFK